jgi:hypothetical protein
MSAPFPPGSVAVLLGSGASWPKGDKSVRTLTEKVLDGRDYIRHSDRQYVKAPPNPGLPPWEETVGAVTSFLRRLECFVRPYHERIIGRDVNYEDLYYVIRQLEDEESGELDDPLVATARREISDALAALQCEFLRSLGPEPRSVVEVTTESARYIASVVVRELQDEAERLDHLSWIKNACDKAPGCIASLFTVNHDCVLERFLTSSGIGFVDGFEATGAEGVRHWRPSALQETNGRLSLLKLHGSIDWHRIRPDGEADWYEERIASLASSIDPASIDGADGRRWMAVDPHPLILVGTFNKIVAYTTGVFLDLYAAFRERLRRTETLVVCGYGFGDKGINQQIVEWVYEARSRRIVVVHPRRDELFERARGAIRTNVPRWQQSGVLRVVEKCIEALSWDDVIAAR